MNNNNNSNNNNNNSGSRRKDSTLAISTHPPPLHNRPFLLGAQERMPSVLSLSTPSGDTSASCSRVGEAQRPSEPRGGYRVLLSSSSSSTQSHHRHRLPQVCMQEHSHSNFRLSVTVLGIVAVLFFCLPMVGVEGATPPAILNGLPDAVATVGHWFEYSIPEDAFSGDISHYEITALGANSLPDWLTFDHVTQTLKGIPLPGAERIWLIQIVAYGSVQDNNNNNNEDDDDEYADDVLQLQVITLADSRKSEKQALSMFEGGGRKNNWVKGHHSDKAAPKKDTVDHKQSPHVGISTAECPPNSKKLWASLIPSIEFLSLPTESRYLVLKEVGSFFRVPSQVLSAVGPQSAVIVQQSRPSRLTADNTTNVIAFPFGCGKFDPSSGSTLSVLQLLDDCLTSCHYGPISGGPKSFTVAEWFISSEPPYKQKTATETEAKPKEHRDKRRAVAEDPFPPDMFFMLTTVATDDMFSSFTPSSSSPSPVLVSSSSSTSASSSFSSSSASASFSSFSSSSSLVDVSETTLEVTATTLSESETVSSSDLSETAIEDTPTPTTSLLLTSSSSMFLSSSVPISSSSEEEVEPTPSEIVESTTSESVEPTPFFSSLLVDVSSSEIEQPSSRSVPTTVATTLDPSPDILSTTFVMFFSPSSVPPEVSTSSDGDDESTITFITSSIEIPGTRVIPTSAVTARAENSSPFDMMMSSSFDIFTMTSVVEEVSTTRSLAISTTTVTSEVPFTSTAVEETPVFTVSSAFFTSFSSNEVSIFPTSTTATTLVESVEPTLSSSIETSDFVTESSSVLSETAVEPTISLPPPPPPPTTKTTTTTTTMTTVVPVETSSSVFLPGLTSSEVFVSESSSSLPVESSTVSISPSESTTFIEETPVFGLTSSMFLPPDSTTIVSLSSSVPETAPVSDMTSFVFSSSFATTSVAISVSPSLSVSSEIPSETRVSVSSSSTTTEPTPSITPDSTSFFSLSTSISSSFVEVLLSTSGVLEQTPSTVVVTESSIVSSLSTSVSLLLSPSASRSASESLDVTPTFVSQSATIISESAQFSLTTIITESISLSSSVEIFLSSSIPMETTPSFSETLVVSPSVAASSISDTPAATSAVFELSSSFAVETIPSPSLSSETVTSITSSFEPSSTELFVSSTVEPTPTLPSSSFESSSSLESSTPSTSTAEPTGVFLTPVFSVSSRPLLSDSPTVSTSVVLSVTAASTSVSFAESTPSSSPLVETTPLVVSTSPVSSQAEVTVSTSLVSSQAEVTVSTSLVSSQAEVTLSLPLTTDSVFFSTSVAFSDTFVSTSVSIAETTSSISSSPVFETIAFVSSSSSSVSFQFDVTSSVVPPVETTTEVVLSSSSSSAVSDFPVPPTSSSPLLPTPSPLFSSSSVMPDFSPSATPSPAPPPNALPVLVKPLGSFTVEEGQAFVIPIPDDTFFDMEDGLTPNLNLVLLDQRGNTDFSWLELKRPQIQGLAVFPNRLSFTTDFTFILLAVDSRGDYAQDFITITVNPIAVTGFNLTLTIEGDYAEFQANVTQQVELTSLLATAHGKEMGDVVLLNYFAGSVVVTYSSLSVGSFDCAAQGAWAGAVAVMNADGTYRYSGSAVALFAGRFVLLGSPVFAGPCSTDPAFGSTEPPSVDVETTAAEDKDTVLFLAIMIPGIILAAVVLVGTILALRMYRSRSGERKYLLERQTYRKRSPVVFANELDARPGGRQAYPRLLEEEGPPGSFESHVPEVEPPPIGGGDRNLRSPPPGYEELPDEFFAKYDDFELDLELEEQT